MLELSASAFEPLVAAAKARAVRLAGQDRISLEDAFFLLRALEDLEADGVELFAVGTAGGEVLCRRVESYLSARVGPALAQELELVPIQSAEVHT